MGLLRDLSFNDLEREVELPNGDKFTVGGIALNDIMVLVARRQTELNQMFSQFVTASVDADRSEIADDRARGIAVTLLNTAPDLAADIIAIASGGIDDELVTVVRKLPFPVQLAALAAIAELTFTSEMPPKKVVEMVVQMMQGTREALPA